MSVCVRACVSVCYRAQAAQVTYMISFWYQHVRHRLGSVLKKVLERFDHIRDRGGRKRVEKHVFWAFFAHFLSDLFPKVSILIFMVCIDYQ